MNTIPTPTIQVGSRSIKAEYLIRTDDDGTQHVAELNVFHHGKAEYVGRPDKCYTASLTRVTVEQRHGHTVRVFTLYSGANLGSEKTERLNARKMRAFFDSIVARLPEFIANNATVASIFDPSS